jgi:hypothetical protein
MYVLKTFKRKKLTERISTKEILSMQYFTDKEFNKANQFKDQLDEYFKSHELPIEIQLQKLEV